MTIKVRTPLWNNFLGSGSDYPAYFRRHGGATLVTTIDEYTYVTVRPLCTCFGHPMGITPLALGAERSTALQQSLLLFYTGIQRRAHDLLGYSKI